MTDAVGRLMVRARRRVGVLLPLLLWAGMAALPGPVRAQEDPVEEILAFDVDVVLGDGGIMTVTESIEVRALGRTIRRGIFRDIPTRFPRDEGIGTIVAPLEVLRVERNGAPEPYAIETVQGPRGRSGVRVRIGEASRFLDEGIHRYTLVYRTERWMRFGDDRDSLAWNVTGNGWDFPIARATARIDLPGDVSSEEVRLQAWTGPEGSTEEEARASFRPAADEAVFVTTEPLGAREGLTVEVGLPAGVVEPPGVEQRRAWFWLDWRGYVEAVALSLVILLLYLGLWVRVGRDPARDAVVVRYEPPDGFSPAGLGYLQERGFGSPLLTATMVNLAVRGAVRLERDGDDWIVEPTGQEPDDLRYEEKRFLKDLTRSGKLTLSGSTNSRLRRATSTLRNRLENSLKGRYFQLNRRWFLAGAAASALAFAALAFRYRWDVPAEAWGMGLWLTFWSIGTAVLVVGVVRTWWAVIRGELAAVGSAVGTTLFALPFVAAEVGVAWFLYHRIPGHLVVAAIALGALNVLFFRLLERPTLRGRGVLTELEGFRRFLEGTEADRFDRLQEPDRPLELFERFLPHAIALKVENRWAERFEGALEAARRTAGAAAGEGISPSWYSGTSGFSTTTGLSRSLGSSLGSTLSSSSSAPSSSGGGSSSSGGSSGGGGGGGGGGGW